MTRSFLRERAGEWISRSPHAESGLAWEGNVLVHRGSTVTGASVEELVRALMSIGSTARDVIAILQNLRAAGALEAEVEVI